MIPADGGKAVKRILVAMDFSGHAERAFDWAQALARRFSAELEIVTSVFAVPFAVVPGGYAAPLDDLRAARAATERRLEERVAELTGSGLRARYTVLHEDPSSGLCALALEKAVDLVALGTRGRAGLAHVLLGSVAERVARLAHCPVLTVHEGVSAPRPLRKLLVASDFSDPAAAALLLARTLLEPGGSIVVTHAIQPVRRAIPRCRSRTRGARRGRARSSRSSRHRLQARGSSSTCAIRTRRPACWRPRRSTRPMRS